MLGYFGTAITNFTVEYHVIARKVARFEMQRGFLEAQLVRQAVPSRQVMLTSGEYMGLNGGGNTTPSMWSRHACFDSSSTVAIAGMQSRPWRRHWLSALPCAHINRSVARPLTLTRLPLNHTAQPQHHERHVKCIDLPRSRTGLVELERSSS
jgi:hypothetical protein